MPDSSTPQADTSDIAALDPGGVIDHLVYGVTDPASALDADHPAPAGTAIPFDLDSLPGDRLLTWAIHPADAEAAVETARSLGADHGRLTQMSRVDNHGRELRWRLAVASPAPYDGLAPFIIDWGDSPHPAASGIPTAHLTALALRHPDAERLTDLLRSDGLAVVVAPGPASLTASIAGPRGSIAL